MRSSSGKFVACAVFACVALLSSVASATVILDTVPIGNPLNPADAAHFNRGSVGYTYEISKYEVTNNQYTEFLNTVDPTGANALSLWATNMGSVAQGNGGITQNPGNPNGSKYVIKPGQGNQPVVFASTLSAMRMANWMHNGQGAGSTETGAYNISLTGPVRMVGATVWLPSVNEWWKAAYYDPNTSSYWTYATGSNTAPNNVVPPGAGSNNANYKGGNNTFAVTQTTGSTVTATDYLSDVGAYNSSFSIFGTFDQNGNVAEWADDLVSTSSRYNLGGSFASSSSVTAFGAGQNLVAAAQTTSSSAIGFRLAIPEPGSVSTVLLLGWAAAMRRRAAR